MWGLPRKGSWMWPAKHNMWVSWCQNDSRKAESMLWGMLMPCWSSHCQENPHLQNKSNLKPRGCATATQHFDPSTDFTRRAKLHSGPDPQYQSSPISSPTWWSRTVKKIIDAIPPLPYLFRFTVRAGSDHLQLTIPRLEDSFGIQINFLASPWRHVDPYTDLEHV